MGCVQECEFLEQERYQSCSIWFHKGQKRHKMAARWGEVAVIRGTWWNMVRIHNKYQRLHRVLGAKNEKEVRIIGDFHTGNMHHRRCHMGTNAATWEQN